MGVAPEPFDREAWRSRRARRGVREKVRGAARSASAALVGIPARSVVDRVLEREAKPLARSTAVREGRRWMERANVVSIAREFGVGSSEEIGRIIYSLLATSFSF